MSRSIFVIDDNALTRKLVGDALSELGYLPVPCASAEEALAAISNEVPSACVVDQVMPRMCGAEFIRALRSSPNALARAVPVIGLTALGEDDLIAAGATTCVRKPLTRARLSCAVDEALAMTQTDSRASAIDTSPSLADLHRRARNGMLTPRERALYESMREEHARATLAVQQVSPPGEARNRRALRVSVVLPVRLATGSEEFEGVTSDLGPGGFGTILQTSALRRGDEVLFELAAPPGDVVVGHARVASTARDAMGLGHRVGFQFVNVAPALAERVRNVVFDRLISGVAHELPPHSTAAH